MATRIVTTLIDDLDGSVADETVRFGLDGADYEIDLSQANASVLREKVTVFAEAARKSKTTVRAANKRNSRTQLIRAWALENGYAVKDRGQIRAGIVAAYEATRN